MFTPSFYTKQTVLEEGKKSVFVFEPLSQSFGHTMGNAYRRTLLSAIPGAAITAVKIAGVSHLFSTIPGVKESVLDIVMNLKLARFTTPQEEGKFKMSLVSKGAGKVFAKDLEGEATVVNGDLYIAELTTDKAKIDLEVVVEVGYGFSPTEERDEADAGYIAIDTSFSPIKHVNFSVTEARVGRKSNFEKVSLEVTTDGSISPEGAVKKVSEILSSQFAHVMSGKDVAPAEVEVSETDVKKLNGESSSKAMETIIDELNLPSRVINALLREKIETVADLVKRGKADLVGLKGVGRKSIDLIEEELKKMGVELA
ncbi:MAG: DNA-directed RNA polymerase subunit alpha [Patescibacteria group bacterium]